MSKLILFIGIFVLAFAAIAEAVPSVSNVTVLPSSPSAGQDLLCNYTYSSPSNYNEQNSSYEWWKNSVNQNINSHVLSKSYLSVNDTWYCKVTPYDGVSLGTQVQSLNTVTIDSTVKNPSFLINGITVWNKSGYYSESEIIMHFNSALQTVLNNCSAGNDGYCNISLTFSSEATGLMNITDIQIFYDILDPSLVIRNLSIINSSNSYYFFTIYASNNGQLNLSNVSWTFHTGESLVSGITNITLHVGESVFLYIEQNYSSKGNFTINTSIKSGNLTTASYPYNISFGEIVIKALNAYTDATKVFFEMYVQNLLNQTMTNINFTLNTSEEYIVSTIPFNLTANETIIILVDYNYSSYQNFTVKSSVFDALYNDLESIFYNLREIDVSELASRYQNSTYRIFDFIITNYWLSNKTVAWQFNTTSAFINSTINTTLIPNETVIVYVEYNFTNTTGFEVTAHASTENTNRSMKVTI